MTTSNDDGNLDAMNRQYGTFGKSRLPKEPPAPKAVSPVRRNVSAAGVDYNSRPMSAKEAERRFNAAGDMTNLLKRNAARYSPAKPKPAPKSTPLVRSTIPTRPSTPMQAPPGSRVRFGAK